MVGKEFYIFSDGKNSLTFATTQKIRLGQLFQYSQLLLHIVLKQDHLIVLKYPLRCDNVLNPSNFPMYIKLKSYI